MALETLKDVKEIGGFRVMTERTIDKDGIVDWVKTDDMRKEMPIFVDQNVNMISFRMQNGPIKEVGRNGCQVDTLIHAARAIVSKLNEKFSCESNEVCIEYLDNAIGALESRTKDREQRGVEGTNQK